MNSMLALNSGTLFYLHYGTVLPVHLKASVLNARATSPGYRYCIQTAQDSPRFRLKSASVPVSGTLLLSSVETYGTLIHLLS